MNAITPKSFFLLVRILALTVLVLYFALAASGCREYESDELSTPQCEPSNVSPPCKQADMDIPHEKAKDTSTDSAPVGSLQGEQSFGKYDARIYRDMDTGEGSFEVLRSGKQVYTQKGFKFYFGHADGNEEEDNLISIGKDITGDGKPNLVISEWTGGMHCCLISSVFEIDDHFRKVATINGMHSGVGFTDLNGDGKLEVTFRDWTFAYWWTSFAASPAPGLILSYQDGSYKLAADLMRKPAPTVTELEERVERVRDGDSWAVMDNLSGGIPPSHFWGYTLDLIYSGNAKYAWKFVDMAWPQNSTGKEEFIKAFKKRLAMSPYWREIEAMNAQ